MTESGLFDCIVVDSVSALVPESEMEADFEENVQPARQAALMSRALRKLVGVVSKRDVLLIFINQMRIKIGVRFGNPKTTSGGQALKFYASVRLELTNMKTVRKGDRVTGRRTRIRTVKNKVAPPFRDIYCDVEPNKGIVAVHGDPDFAGGSSDE
jgi:recombination protein RecA